MGTLGRIGRNNEIKALVRPETGQASGQGGQALRRARRAARRLVRDEAAYGLSDIGPRPVRQQPDVVVEAQSAHVGRARRVHPLERMLNRGAISRAQHDAGMAVCNRAAAVELCGGSGTVWLGQRVDGGGGAPDDLRMLKAVQATRHYLSAIAMLDGTPGSAGQPGLSQRDLVRRVAVDRCCVADLAGPSARARTALAGMLRRCLDAVQEQTTKNA